MYFLGVDGGGTKTAYCIIDENLKIIKKFTSGPSSCDTVGEDGFIKNVNEALKSLSLDEKIGCAFFGIGGITDDLQKEKLAKKLLEIDLLKDAIVSCDNDIVNALYAGGEENAMAAILGTGSVCYGMNNNVSHRCGGYCFEEGDPASAYDLGIKALRHVARVYDKREHETILSNMIMKEYNLNKFKDIVDLMQSGRTSVANVAKIVTKCADTNCSKSIEIINKAIDEFMLMAITVYNELKFKNVNLYITGSVGLSDTYFRKRLLFELKEKLPLVKVCDNLYDAYYASAIKAYKDYQKIINK